MIAAQISLVIPSYQQAAFLRAALQSVMAQNLSLEIIVMDGGSTDGSIEIIREFSAYLAYWQSGPDGGQAAAINAGMARATAPFVCWLNSDDMFLPGGLSILYEALRQNPSTPAVYGMVDNCDHTGRITHPVWVQPFAKRWLANRCLISQPGTLMRREAWQAVAGLDTKLHLALDYDLWWRLYRHGGPLQFVPQRVALNRMHDATKTQSMRAAHYREAMAVVRRHYGRVPLKWYLYWPYAVGWQQLLVPQRTDRHG